MTGRWTRWVGLVALVCACGRGWGEDAISPPFAPRAGEWRSAEGRGAPEGAGWRRVVGGSTVGGGRTRVAATVCPDPTGFGLWWPGFGTMWQTGPVGFYFEPEGVVVCDTEGAVSVEW